MNPLLEDWTTPFGLPPFERIDDSHFAPAFEAAIKAAREAVDTIAANPEPASFGNTIVPLECSDALLDRVAGVFFNVAGADTNDAREALQRDLSPKLSQLYSDIMTNENLSRRVASVAGNAEGLNAEQARVAELYHRRFRRSGALLNETDRDHLKGIMSRLASLGTAFTQNVLADERAWSLPLGKADLEGLPQFLRDALRSSAQERGEEGYLLTLTPALIDPFLKFSPNRELRRKAYAAWTARGALGGDTDNRATIAETLALRSERATMLGYPDFAHFKLEEEMARTPDRVRNLLTDVWKPAHAGALRDHAVLTEYMQKDGLNGPLEAWDWAYYGEKRRQDRFDLDEAAIKPFFQLDNMIAASFDCASRLFNLSFERLDIPLYHEDAMIWDVTRDGRHIGVFIGDYFARASKRSGAWCSRFRSQSRVDGDVRPIVVNVCNFAKAPAGEPTLLSFDDARTLFHEFGHALHSLLSDVTYPLIAGTNVARDFVELPSQLYEHWLSVPEVLAKFAVHKDTGTTIDAALVDRLVAAEKAEQAQFTITYISSAMVDLDLHTGPPAADPVAAEAAILAQLDMPPAIDMRHAASHFKHVFSGDGYSSGYYSYLWSEVMDADAFAAFRDAGDAFDPEIAARLERHIYSAGGSRDPVELYTAFRGSMPKVDALLEKRGFKAA